MTAFHLPARVDVWLRESPERAPSEVVAFGKACYPDIALAFSGAEDVVLIDVAHRLELSIATFCIDTGRLPAETHRFWERVRKHYGLTLEILVPDASELSKLVTEKGLFSFYEDGHEPCCKIRKVEPLKKRLHRASAWMTGQRRDQNPATRGALPLVEMDATFSTPDHPIVKFNPLALWSHEEVWRYIQENDVPVNELYRRGFRSIGCEPCTRPVLPHEPERLGRWWWEDESKKECGLHAQNLTPRK